jgi:uncharacterized membrane protein
MNNNRDIAVSVILAIALLAAVLLDIEAVRLILAVPLLLFLPGHLALRAIRMTLPPIEHAAAAAGASIAICVAAGFVLYGMSALTPIGWSLWVLLVIGSLSAWILHYRIPGGLGIRLPTMRRAPAVTMVLAALVATEAYLVAVRDEANTRQFSYTEFWLIPTQPGKLALGIQNSEFRPEVYDVVVTSHGAIVANFNSIKLNPNGIWTHAIDSFHKTEAMLYRGRDQTVYRRVTAIPYGAIRE